MERPQKKSKAEAGNFIRISYKYLAYPTDLQIYRMENGNNTAGTVNPKLVPVLSKQTPVEAGDSAAPALAISPVVEAQRPRLMLHLSRG